MVNDRGHLMEVQRSDDEHFIGSGRRMSRARGAAWSRPGTGTTSRFDQLALVRGGPLVVCP